MTKKLKKYILVYIPTGDVVSYLKLYPNCNKRFINSEQKDIYLSLKLATTDYKIRWYNKKNKNDCGIVILKRYIKPSVNEYIKYLDFFRGRVTREEKKSIAAGCTLTTAIDMLSMDIRKCIGFSPTTHHVLPIEFEVTELV